MWLALAGLLPAGCPGAGQQSSDVDTVDTVRLETLKREPVLKLAVGQPYAEAGFHVSDKLPAHRGKVTADLNKPADPGKDRDRAVEALKALRDSAWTVFYARCDHDGFTASAYRVVDGVSFYAQIDGSDVQGKNVVLQMRAPQSRESTSDLFPERPPAVAAGKTCLEADSSLGEDGTPIVLDELASDPDGPAKPQGHR